MRGEERPWWRKMFPARAGGREVDGSVHVARGDSALPALAAGRRHRAAAGPALWPLATRA